VKVRTSQSCEGLVRARLSWGRRRGGSESRTALATAASIVTRTAGTVAFVIVALALALPGVAQASPKPDPTPQAAPSSGGGPSPDPAPQAHSSSSNSSASPSSTSGQTVSGPSSSSGEASYPASSPVVVQPSISGVAVAEPSTSTTHSSGGGAATGDQVPLKSLALQRAAHTTKRAARHHATDPRIHLQPSFLRHLISLPALTVFNARLPAPARNGLLLLLGAGALFVLAAASGSLLRIIRRLSADHRGR
jgi:hypothetical protein